MIELVIQNWKSFFAANSDYRVNPQKYKGKPKIPRYANKDGRKPVMFSNQTCLIKENEDGSKFIKFPKTKSTYQIGNVELPNGQFKQVRIVPNSNYYIVELIFEMPIIEVKTTKEGQFTSKRLKQLDTKRHDYMKDFFHKVSRQIVNYCVENNIDTIVIGKNKGWKIEVSLQKNDKQNFINIPYNLFIQLLEYKAKELGILVIISEESYTSKASFLDRDNIPTYGQLENEPKFLGYRATRGMYKSYKYGLINADVNGSANILRKVFPNAFVGGRDSGVVTTPKLLLVA